MWLTHSGLVCSVGLNAAAACAAMRAGIAGFADLPYVDNSGEPIVGAAVPSLAPEVKRDERLLALLEGALQDCLKSAGFERTDLIPLLVGLAEPGRPGGADGLAGNLIERVQKRLDKRFHPALSRCLPRGHTAGFELLQVAREILQDSRVPCCLVAAVDSYLNASSLAWLDRHGRLKTLDNSDGVIPGEAGAAILMIRPPSSATTDGGMRLAGLGFAQESAAVLAEEPLLGLGLASAVRAALQEAALQMSEIGFRIADVTGESYGFKEQSLVLSRVLRNGPSQLPLWHCADAIGDVGAAAGVCEWIVAERAFRKRYAPGASAMCTASAVLGERASAVMTFESQRLPGNDTG